MFIIRLELEEGSRKYLDDLPGKIRTGTTEGIVRAMLYAKEKAKDIFLPSRSRYAPKPLPPPGPLYWRTKKLKRSIEAGPDWIGTDVEYGYRHEITGVGRGRRPFLMPSFEGSNMDTVKDMILDEILKEASK